MSGNRNDMAWKVLKRDIVFQDTWVQLEASRCELPDGRIIEPFYVKRDPDFAVVVAVTKDGRLVLVRQYRHGVEKVLLELPAGAIEKGDIRRWLPDGSFWRKQAIRPDIWSF